MKLWIKRAAILLAAALLPVAAACAEEMPIVTDEPLTAQEQAEAAGQQDATDGAGEEEAADNQIAKAQQMLINLKLLDGAADGIFGPRTAQAVRAFQDWYSLPVTGMLDEKTMAKLAEKSESADAARVVQQRLIDLGYLRGKADGIFGERSKAALKLFQSLQGLEVTGEMDAETEAALYRDDVPLLPAQLSNGDKGDEVKALQERLILFGFLTDKADGSYGPATAAAVKRFQSHLIEQGVDSGMGIVANGIATPATLLMLFDENYSSYLTDIAPGDEGDEVQRIERRLKELGYMDLQPDKVFDDYAARCAAAFRTAARLGLGGTVDKATVDALFSEDAPVAEHYVLHDIAYKDKGDAVRKLEQALALGGMSVKLPNGRYDDDVKAAVAELHKYLSDRQVPGAESFSDPGVVSVAAQEMLENGLLIDTEQMDPSDASTLKRVQRRLHLLYYLEKSAIDGKAGDMTTEALKAFQSVNGLEQTGVADPATLKLLFSEEAVSKRLPYRVEISLDDQRVYVYELNEQGDYEQTQAFICSTGLGNSTPRGIFLDGYPVNVWHHFEKYNCWAKYSFEVEGNIMLHSVIYDEPDDKTLRENSLYALGQKASHGCIRLKVADARWLFEHCKRGSLVIVIY